MPKLSAETPFVHDDCSLQEADLGPYTEVGRGTRIAFSTLGAYSYCDRGCDIANATIGRFANIASAVRLGATDHPMDRASQHHFLYRSASYWDDVEDDAAWFVKRRARRLTIGHDTWIGHAAQVKPEVAVGHGAVIAAGAVVTRDVAPYTIVGGVPAQPIRARFSVDIADRLIALAWWSWSHDSLRAALEDFRTLSVDAFLEKYGG